MTPILSFKKFYEDQSKICTHTRISTEFFIIVILFSIQLSLCIMLFFLAFTFYPDEFPYLCSLSLSPSPHPSFSLSRSSDLMVPGNPSQPAGGTWSKLQSKLIPGEGVHLHTQNVPSPLQAGIQHSQSWHCIGDLTDLCFELYDLLSTKSI